MYPSSFPTYRIPIGSPLDLHWDPGRRNQRRQRRGDLRYLPAKTVPATVCSTKTCRLTFQYVFFLNFPKWLCVKTLVGSTYHHISENNPGTHPSTYHYPIHNHPWLARWWMVILWNMDRFGPSPIQASNSSNSSAPQWNTKYDHEPDIYRWFRTTPPTKCIWIYMIIDL